MGVRLRPGANRWIRFPEPRPDAALRLLCFPYAGAGASVYLDWPSHLLDCVEVVCVQPPGRENRFSEAPFDRVSPLAAASSEALSPVLDRPFAFFGHSMGALHAFVLTHLLADSGGPMPFRLFVSGSSGPRSGELGTAHRLPDHELAQHMRQLGGTPEDVLANGELLETLLPLIRADLAVVEAEECRFDAPLPIPIRAFAGDGDRLSPPHEVAGWEHESSTAFALTRVPGGHFFQQEQVELVLQVIRSDLERDRLRLAA